MKGSIQRVRDIIQGRIPDRPPLYDLLRNDAVIRHFSGTTLTVENAPETVYRAYEPAIDATRPMIRLPRHEALELLGDGREQRVFRWTVWTAPKVYADSADYEKAKRAELAAYAGTHAGRGSGSGSGGSGGGCAADGRASNDPGGWTRADQAGMDAFFAETAEQRRKLGECFLFPGIPGVGLMGLFGEVGFDQFCYYLADCPDIIDELLEANTQRTLAWIDHLPADHGMEAGFLGDDIAFNSGPLFSPTWLRDHFFPRLERVIDAYHRRGITVLFHSDGNLNLILDDLVAAGIDGLNPIEILAGMDVGDIHRRYPKLFMAGGIDVSQLLPFGSPAQVYDTVRRTIDDAEGRIMIGSSTELNDDVPLENYLALRRAVLGEGL